MEQAYYSYPAVFPWAAHELPSSIQGTDNHLQSLSRLGLSYWWSRLSPMFHHNSFTHSLNSFIPVGPPCKSAKSTTALYACFLCYSRHLMKWPGWWGQEDSRSPRFLQTKQNWIIQEGFLYIQIIRTVLEQNVSKSCFDKDIGTVNHTIVYSTYCPFSLWSYCIISSLFTVSLILYLNNTC